MSKLGLTSCAKPKEAESKKSTRDYLPKIKYCEKCHEERMLPTRKLEIYDEYCPACGTKLSERVDDIYVELYWPDQPKEIYRSPILVQDYSPFDHSPRIRSEGEPDVNPSPTAPHKCNRPQGKMISLRDLVRLIEEYKKDVVIEDL